jgi:5,10-methylenetetrahydromethanopterin reductase
MEIGLNFNGDREFIETQQKAAAAEKMGFSNIWVGESIHFSHPYPVIAAIAHSTRDITIGSGIISYFFNRGLHIKKAFETFVEAWGQRFAIALAPGDVNSLRECGIDPSKPLQKLKTTLEILRASRKLGETPIYVGASGPRMIEMGSTHADGVLLNYAYPEYVKWALDHLQSDTFVAVYAPALLTPDRKNEKAAIWASAFVASGSNKSFQEDFGLGEDVEQIRGFLGENNFAALLEKKDFLLERFTIHGDEQALIRRLREYKGMGVDQVILGSPFTYSYAAIKNLGNVIQSKKIK